MSTRIPISADSSQATAAVDQIAAAIRKAGQEGRKFSELDLSHPELKDLADDITRMQSNFNTMKSFKNTSQTARTVDAGNYTDVLDWAKSHGKQFTNEDERRKHFATAGNNFTYGTRWNTPPPGSNPPGTGSNSSFGFSGIPVPGVGKLLGIGLGLAGIGKISSMLSEGVSGAADESVQVDTFKRIIGDTSTEFDDLRQSIRDAGDGLQLTNAETIKLAQSFAKASNYADSHRINEEVKTSAGFARSFGLDPNQVTRSFGESRFLQVGGGSDTSPKEMAVMFADAIAAGGMWSKAGEVIDSIIGFTRQSERVMVDSPNVRAYADLSSTMNASERPGLQGQAGAALLNAINAAMQNGGGAGVAGQNFMWRALNPDGKMGPFEMRILQERGMFGKLPDGRTNFEAVNSLAKQQYANPLQRADALANLFNTSMTQMMAMMNLMPGSHGALGEMIKKYDINPESIDSTSYQGLADVATANGSRLEVLRGDLLKRDDLTGAQKRTVRNAEGEDGLRRALATTIASAGREQTTGLKTLGSIVAMKNALTNTSGPLLSPINEIRDFTAQMVKSPVDTTEDTVQGLLRSASGVAMDASDYLKGYKRHRRSGSASGGMNYVDGVPEFANQKEIKLVNEVTVIHKNDKGGVINREHLPSTTVQIRE